MNPLIKNILALIAGLVVGSIVNMSLIMISGSVIPPPEGADNTTMDGLKATMHLFEAKHFIFPFLAHALGTLTGAITAIKIAATHQTKLGYAIGGLFLLGGIYSVMNLPSPLWFSVLDLVAAYIPMAWLANRVVKN